MWNIPGHHQKTWNVKANKVQFAWQVITLRPVPYFPDMWTSGPIFSWEVRFFPDIDHGMSGGDFVNYTEPTTHVFRCF